MILWPKYPVLGCMLAILLILSLQAEVLSQTPAAMEGAPSATLTSAAEIRRLSEESASAGVPVELRCVVTLIDPQRTVFVQDSTGGTFIRLGKNMLPDVVSGQAIRVTGRTYPGLYLPGIVPEQIEILGTSHLPEPRPITMEELASGQHNYEWVQVRGIIRAVQADSERTILLLASGNGRLEVHLLGSFPAPHLIDTTVRVTGLAAGFINDKRQLVAPHLRIRDLADVIVEEAAPLEPFAQAAIPASSLLQFSPEWRPGHRVKVQGVVTLHDAGRALFLRDGEQGLYVETTQSDVARPGDVVEVLGFPEMGRFSAYLQNASFRVTGTGDPPSPIHTTTMELLKGTRDGDLVTIEAQLVKILGGPGESALLMQADDTVFRARSLVTDGLAATLRIGSTLRITGVCQIAEADHQAAGFRSSPRSFELLLRSPADIALVRTAPWWNAQRLAIAAGLLLAVTTVALVWVALLRHQVRRQTVLLRNKVESEIVLEERQRLAREFHDTLEQELIGLSLRLDALATRVSEPKPRELLDSTRKLLQRLQVEVRTLLWDLRERPSIRGNLATAIRQATNAVADQISLEVQVSGDTSSLTELTQHHLVRIAQEAVTNAVKHGRANAVQVEVRLTPDATRLTIRDNGSGFDPSGSPARPGHFGILGMRERARKVSGDLEILSAPGDATTITLQIPHSCGSKPALQTSSLIG